MFWRKKPDNGNGRCSEELKKFRELTRELNGGLELSEEEVQSRRVEIFEKFKQLTHGLTR